MQSITIIISNLRSNNIIHQVDQSLEQAEWLKQARVWVINMWANYTHIVSLSTHHDMSIYIVDLEGDSLWHIPGTHYSLHYFYLLFFFFSFSFSLPCQLVDSNQLSSWLFLFIICSWSRTSSRPSIVLQLHCWLLIILGYSLFLSSSRYSIVLQLHVVCIRSLQKF